jgi:hypothetical protein
MQITNAPTGIIYTEINERSIQIEWTDGTGKRKSLSFLCSELCEIMHDHIDMGHEWINASYDYLGNYFANIIQDDIPKSVHLATYTPPQRNEEAKANHSIIRTNLRRDENRIYYRRLLNESGLKEKTGRPVEVLPGYYKSLTQK